MTDPLTSLQAALVDRYLIERELGRGGMATVYLARDLKHDRLVAIKLLRPELAATLGADRFLREIQTTANLQHPHILPLFDSGAISLPTDSRLTTHDPRLTTHDSRLLFYVMPYIDGETLRHRMTREGQLPIDDTVRIARDVAAALGYAHERGVVHRDIKPENILLSGGQAVVADFGIARALSAASGDRLTETGLALGTPHYMSPEQATGDPHVDGRTDTYALGCVVYEMLAGEPPHTGATAQAIIARRMVDSVPRIRTVRETVPEEMERAIARALAKAPADRFRTTPEFAGALTHAIDAPPPVVRPGGIGARWRTGAVLLALLVAGVAALQLWRRAPAAGNIAPSASLIAVLPFTPSGSDTALSRLGRDLVFTMSAELDGLGGIRVVDARTVLAQAKPGDLVTPDEGAAWARRFGAGSIVSGSLVREGADVRLDFVLLSTDSVARPLARASVSSAPDSIAALTDSAVHALLRQVWTRGDAPTPSLEAALKTRSAPALRAFLEGERQIVGGWWDSASASYSLARQADTSFWLAYAREQYAQGWSIISPADSLVQLLTMHRAELPEPERLGMEANELQWQGSIGVALDRARLVTERNPSSWMGWLNYADQLLHSGPLQGHTRDEVRGGFQRALELNPNLIPVHEHLMLLALEDRDTAAASQGLRELVRLDAGPSLTAGGYGDVLLNYRFLDGILRGDSALVGRLVDSVALDPAPEAVDGSFFDAFRFGFLKEQIRVSDRALQLGVSPMRQAVHGGLLVASWAGRGAWDSALVAMDRLVKSGNDSLATLHAYGLAVVGVWLGAVDQHEADARRAAAVKFAQPSPANRAEVAWLDGLTAVSKRDRRGVAQARAALQATAAPEVPTLDRSLAAFDTALAGSNAAAGAAMAELAWQGAALADHDLNSHVFTIAVNRLAAARWLAAAGDTAQALRLLTWIDGPFLLHNSTTWSGMLAGLVDLERGRIEERAGRTDQALRYYREFLRMYDRPVPAHRPLVEEGNAAVKRLAGTS